MNIYIPPQTKPDRDAFPTKPRKIKAWLKDLPLVNMGETTKAFYTGLRQLNRLEIPIKDRLSIMELLRPQARMILDHLHKHLVSRSLPLPAKSRKIVGLTQTLMLEMAIGYKACLHPVLTGSARLDTKRLALATHRAMRYLGQALLQSAQVYAPDPCDVWSDIHRLYRLAEDKSLLKRAVKDDHYHTLKQSTIPDVYKQICLLALSRPQTLRQGEAEKLAAYFERMGPACEMHTEPVPDALNGVYVTHLAENEPPMYVPHADVPESADIRSFDLQAVVRDIRETMQKGDFDQTASIINRSELGFDLMRRLLMNLGSTAKRRFSRAQKDDEITIAIGLNNIHQAIREDSDSLFNTQDPPAQHQPRFDELSLQSLGDTERADTREHFNPLATNIWDIVARGNIVTEENQAQIKEAQRPPAPPPSSAESWKISNASAGGYGLCWEGDQPSRVQVGEIVGLRELEGNAHQWRIGVVRWMQFEEERGLEIGVQLLAPKTLLISIEEVINRSPGVKLPIKAFMLPGIKTIEIPPSVIVPAHQFAAGDELRITLFHRDLSISLTALGEHTSAFAQFRYTTHKDKHTENAKEGFDSLWSSL